MRTAKILVCVSLLLAMSVLSSSCASEVPATITRHSSIPLSANAKIFLMANRQHERIAQSLKTAGLPVSNEWDGGGYTLTVKLGSRRSSKDCGSVQNVSYSLGGMGQRRLLAIKGRGATGECEPNIFDDMSRTLASQFTAK